MSVVRLVRPVSSVALGRLAPTPPRVALVAALAVVVVAVALLRPGGPLAYVVVAGDSMLPTLSGGDVVLLHARDDYGAGDVVAYRVPDGEPGEGVVVIHRIVGGSEENGFAVRGDNKQDVDPWTPRARDVVGAQVLRVPKLGLAVAFVRTPLGLSLLAASVTIAIVLGADAGRRGRA